MQQYYLFLVNNKISDWGTVIINEVSRKFPEKVHSYVLKYEKIELLSYAIHSHIRYQQNIETF